MSSLQEYYTQLREHLHLLIEAVPELKCRSDLMTVLSEYMKEQEFGLAFDLVIWFINEQKLNPNSTARSHIRFLYNAMELEDSRIEGLI